MDILKILFVILLLALPIGELGRYIFPQIGLFNDFLVGVVVFVWILQTIKNRRFQKQKLLLPIGLFLFFCILSLLLNIFTLPNEGIIQAALYILRWIVYAGLYFVVKDFDKKFKQKIPLLIVFSGTLMVLIGYIQFIYYSSLRNLYYLGWDEHLYRMFSVFLDPNFAGIFFVLLFMLLVGMFSMRLIEKKKSQAMFFAFFGALTFIAIYLTYSRSAFLMLVISVISFLILLGQKKMSILFLIFAVLFIFLIPKSFQTDGTNLLRVASSEARLESAGKAIQIFRSSPIYGVGFNAYRYAQKRFHFISDVNWQTTHAGAGADNSFLFVLATTGVIGFSTYCFLWFTILKQTMVSFKSKNTQQRTFSIVVFSSTIGLLVSAFFMNSLFYVFVMEWMWIVLGLTEST